MKALESIWEISVNTVTQGHPAFKTPARLFVEAQRVTLIPRWKEVYRSQMEECVDFLEHVVTKLRETVHQTESSS